MSFRVPWMTDYNIAISDELRKYHELEIQVKQLTGYNFKCLLEMFKSGFTLKPPEYELSMNQVLTICEANRLGGD